MYKVLYRSQGKWLDLSVTLNSLEDCYTIILESEHYDNKYSKLPPKYAIQDLKTERIFDKHGTYLDTEEKEANLATF